MQPPRPPSFAVAVLTRNRPAKVQRCLAALAVAQEEDEFIVYLCDSSDEPLAAQTREIGSRYSWVRYAPHRSPNAAAARNFCARQVDTDLIVSVDDDVYIEADAVSTIVRAYAQNGDGVLAGSVGWRNMWGTYDWSTPQRMQLSGHSGPIGPGQRADYLVSAFFIYSTNLALTMPWPEHLQWSEDMYMGLWWNAVGVPLRFEPHARAVHDDEHSDRNDARSRSYVVLYRDLATRPSLRRAVLSSIWAFLAEGRDQRQRGRPLHKFLGEWLLGMADFAKNARRERACLAKARAIVVDLNPAAAPASNRARGR